MIALVTTALTVLAIVLEAVVQYRNAPQRAQEKANEADQELRQNCLDLNADAVNMRIDLSLPPAASDHPPVLSDSEVIGRLTGTL